MPREISVPAGAPQAWVWSAAVPGCMNVHPGQTAFFRPDGTLGKIVDNATDRTVCMADTTIPGGYAFFDEGGVRSILLQNGGLLAIEGIIRTRQAAAEGAILEHVAYR